MNNLHDKHGIIFTGANYLDTGRKGGGAKRIANHCAPHGWDIEVVEYFSFWSNSNLEQFLNQNVKLGTTKFIGFSYTWLSNDANFEAKVNYIKQLYPDILIIVGGQTPFETDLGADYYVFGYGEEAILAILDYEFDNGPFVKYTRLFDGKYVDGINQYTSHNLKEYGISYSDIDLVKPNDLITIELSRGCKFACKFCSFPYIGIKEDTSRSEESIYRELNENYQRWGVTKYLIADDTLNDREEKLIKLRNAVNRLDFKPDFSGYIRLDLFKSHPEHLELLGEINMWGHFYGVETFNHETGKIVGKGMHPDTMKQLLLDTRSYFNKHLGNYRGTAGVIAGLPKESIEQMKETHQWFIDNWSDQCAVWHPLQIMQTAGTMQAFGKDLSKYGYKKIEDPDSEQYRRWLGKSLMPKLKEKTVFWENEYTNSYEVIELCSEFRKYEFGLSNWSLWSYFSHWPVEEAKQIKVPPYDAYLYEPFTSKAKIWIDDYINKKMLPRP
jgi:radical SAM superfamily enzyme YgiQ (UPF0313 family)